MFGIFTDAFSYNFVIDFKLFYFILFINYLLLLFKNRLKFSRTILLLLLFIFIYSTFYTFFGYNKFSRVTSQFLGIFIVSQYFYIFFSYCNLTVDQFFKIYLKFSYYICIIGLLILFYELIINKNLVQLKSFLTEPAYFAMVILPSYCYYFFNLKDSKNIKYFIVTLSALILSFSSLGFLGLMFCFIYKKIKPLFIILNCLFAILIFTIFYNYVPAFKLRVDDTFKAFVSNDLYGTNLSTYALVSNFLIAKENLISHPFLGNGIGSHKISHTKSIFNLEGVVSFNEEYKYLNSEDADSLLLRTLSELGLFGLFLILFFLFKYYDNSNYTNKIISKSIIVYFILKLIRFGHYFSPELYFFVYLYYYNKIGIHKNSTSNKAVLTI